MKLEIVLEDGKNIILSNVAKFNVIKQLHEYEVAQFPEEGFLFEVKPLEINRTIFENNMYLGTRLKERTRWVIRQAFAEVDNRPEKYANPFYTLIPEKNWKGSKTVAELQEYAKQLGGQMADWVDQTLEWAQRISNGESWEDVCSVKDPAKWYRLIAYKEESCIVVGGRCGSNIDEPVSYVGGVYVTSNEKVYDTVPLVAFKK